MYNKVINKIIFLNKWTVVYIFISIGDHGITILHSNVYVIKCI